MDFYDDEEKFKWDNQKILLLLSLYKKLKVQFRDPKITKRKLWKFIEQKFLKKNYLVTADMLDKKFRNLKQTYLRVQHKRKTGIGRVTWEYLELFDNIYEDDDDIKPKMEKISSTLPSGSINPDSTIWLNNLENAEALIEENSQSIKYEGDTIECTSTEAEFLKIEKTKVQKLSEIADSMKERNKLLKQLINIMQNDYNK